MSTAAQQHSSTAAQQHSSTAAQQHSSTAFKLTKLRFFPVTFFFSLVFFQQNYLPAPHINFWERLCRLPGILSLLFVVNLCAGQAQGFYNNGLSFILSGGGYFVIDGNSNGSYLNEDNGGIRNGEIDGTGTLILEGNWTNNATNNVFINPATKATVVFNGTTTQTIGGTNTTSFENLTVNNTIASGAAVSLDTNTTVSGTLTLTDGVITTGTDTLFLTNTSSTGLLPAVPTNASFVNGNFTRYIASNTSTYAFPCGNGTAGANFYLAELVNNLLTGTNFITAKFGALTNHNDADLIVSEEGTPYTSVGTEGVWYLTPNAAPTGGSYDLKCYTANFAGLADNMFGILSRPDGSLTAADWTCTPCGFCLSPPASPNTCVAGEPGINENGGLGRMLADGYAQRFGLSSFSQFGFGKSGAPLPIELLYFSAEWNDKKQTAALLSWKTLSEINNDYFIVERSIDAINFNAISQIPGAGNSVQLLSYSVLDNEPYKDMTSYYRLKQVDFDGKFTYSQIEALNPPDGINLIIIYPNPSSEYIDYLIYSDKDAAVSVWAIDAAGKTVISENQELKKGVNKQRLNTSHLSSGAYVLQITANDDTKTEKQFVIK